MSTFPNLEGLTVEHRRVFVRVDFNVPLEGGQITDDARIREALPTIRTLLDKGARVVCASHLGRPKPGKHEGFSLEPCAARLSELLGKEVVLPDDCVGESATKVVFDLRPGDLCLLENLRFYPEEEADDVPFAQKLHALADVYVNDAFGCVHRAHASVHALPRLFRERAAGLLLEKEIRALSTLVEGPTRPYVALLGGAKVSDKIEVLEALLQKVDALVIGGAMANTFLAAQGCNMAASKVEGDKLAMARTLLEKAATRGVQVVLPVDVMTGKTLDEPSATPFNVRNLPDGVMALDIGPESVALFASKLAAAKTVFWNGPMGLFEKPPFSRGTFALAECLAKAEAFTVVGGGDSAAAVRAAPGDLASKMGHISTGGGASLEWIEGKKLPGIEVLRT